MKTKTQKDGYLRIPKGLIYRSRDRFFLSLFRKRSNIFFDLGRYRVFMAAVWNTRLLLPVEFSD